MNDFGLQVRHGEYVGHDLEGQIGSGGPRIKIANVNGPIKITHAQDGRAISPATSVIIDRDKIRDEAESDNESDPADRRFEQARAIAEATRASIETSRMTREAQREAQRQVDAALRQAQRDIERAQREIQRQQQEQLRNQQQYLRQQQQLKSDVKVFKKIKPVTVDLSYTKTAKETKSFAVTGSPRVNISTFDGQVTVRGWDKPEVQYTATSSAEDDESLKQLEIITAQNGQTIAITAKNDNNRNATVSFDVFVPRQSSLHVASGDGGVSLDGVSGEITLRSGDGAIEVSNSGGQLQVNTGDGTIQISKFDGQVDARTGDGAIALDGIFKALSARTGDGEISLRVPAGSSFTIETNLPDEISNEGFTVAEDITPSPRLKRWKIGNGGQIFVLRTGDGRILLRPRN
jgi:multidrug efflux pump subunit AcrA (membrane-fusion protein)